jgi:DNA-binding NarL/FixJ family response regulator
MIVLVQATVLTVGLNGRNEILKELPIRLVTMQSGLAAARSLKNEKVNSVISRWDLDDMPDGKFLKGLRAARPSIPTIAFIRPGSKNQEIAARSLGVSAVLAEDATDDMFRETVANLLGLKGDVEIKAISPAENANQLSRER